MASSHQIETYYPLILRAMGDYGIVQLGPRVHFLAQIAVESDSLRYAEEIWPFPNPDAAGIPRNGTEWQLAYEANDLLGNTQPGDGYRFRKRGLLPLLGRKMYAEYGEFKGVDFTSGAGPDRLLEEDYVADCGGWLWKKFGLNELAEENAIGEITLKLLKGETYLKQRQEAAARIRKILIGYS